MKGDKFDNPPTMFAVAESELQRFRKIETENTLLKVQIEGLKKENEQLKAQIEKMKCCHSCLSHKLNNLKNCQTCDGNYSNWELAE